MYDYVVALPEAAQDGIYRFLYYLGNCWLVRRSSTQNTKDRKNLKDDEKAQGKRCWIFLALLFNTTEQWRLQTAKIAKYNNK